MNMITRRGFAALSLATAAARPASAAAWPERTIQVIVPFPPGGGVDQMARMILPYAEKRIPGARFVVDNKPGAASQIGMEFGFNAKPDGYTLIAVTSPAMMMIPFERPVRYRVADFTYIANVVDDPGALWVKDSSPFRSLDQVLEQARKDPGGVTFGTTGIGSDDHLAMLEIEQAVPGVKFSHVPFAGAAPLQTAVMGGHIDVGCFNISEGLPGYQDGRFRCMGHASPTRGTTLKDVPTFTEQGVKVVVGAQRGIVAPPGIPDAIRTTLTEAFVGAINDPEFKAAADRSAMPLSGQSGDAYRDVVLGLDARLQEMWKRQPWRD
jgi:tripartite-type tricarboxylate transporter receptor subunit TctC